MKQEVVDTFTYRELMDFVKACDTPAVFRPILPSMARNQMLTISKSKLIDQLKRESKDA